MAATDAQKASIDALQKFYSTVIGAAFVGAVLKLMDGFDIYVWNTEQVISACIFLAFVMTIIPFYVGMERHLYDSHIAKKYKEERGGRPIPILIDVFAFLIMGMLLFAMGRLISDPVSFLQLWSALLVIDVFWMMLVYRFQRNSEAFWSVNNILWLIAAWLLWWIATPYIDWLFPDIERELIIAFMFTLVETMRSVTDFWVNWKFYFPDEAS